MRSSLLLLVTISFGLVAAPRPADIPFKKLQLDFGANETAAFADINGDGKLDVVNGENWYEHPKAKGGEWKKHHFRELGFFNNYIDAFSDLPLDVNGDGKIDIVSCTWFAKKISWYENPGKLNASWKTSGTWSSCSWWISTTMARRRSCCRSSAGKARRLGMN
jgi:hypothetical protein